jgi:hypothetical protein
VTVQLEGVTVPGASSDESLLVANVSDDQVMMAL